MLDPDRPEASADPAEPAALSADVASDPAHGSSASQIEPLVDASARTDPAPPIEPSPLPRTYELPTARKVVSTGLQLSLASSSELRKASIYIGLLILAAFGPAVVALLLILGRLGDSAGDVFSSLLFAPEDMAINHPELGGVLIVLMLVAIGGLTSYFAISIDAGNIAIAILGGRSAEQPVRLWEAITRARQTFWRVAGAGFLVGLIGGGIQLAISAVVGSFTTSVETSSVLTAVIGTLVLAPLAYVGSSIVLGDVGAIESLSRSWRLFRVRPWLAVVVVLFTLVTSAIQLFALSAGLDLLIRAGELLHVSLTEGALAFGVATLLVLAAVTAFGSLLFTIGAIVAAPQVAAFLGLTFFSGGLDQARSPQARAPKGFRWVTRPMLALLIGTAAVVGLEIPAIGSLEPMAAAPAISFLRATAGLEHGEATWYGAPGTIEDASDATTATGRRELDIVSGDPGWIYEAPPWLLPTVFDCDRPDVACSDGRRDAAGYSEGAFLIVERMAGDPAIEVTGAQPGAWAVLLEVGGVDAVPPVETIRFPGATHAVITTRSLGGWEIALVDFELGTFRTRPTDARSRWVGSDLATIIPVAELPGWPERWDVYAATGDGTSYSREFDQLRTNQLDPLLWFADAPEFDFLPED